MKPFNMHSPLGEINFKENSTFLHGDVIVTRVTDIPESFNEMPEDKEGVLAYGEATFHLHKLFRMSDPDLVAGSAFDLRTDKDGTKYLKVFEPVNLRHQEHVEATIPPGDYVIKIQREYDPFTKRARQVAD